MTRYDGYFDFSSGVPDRQHTTLLDVLSFDDERVRNLMIDVAHIESTVVVKDRKVGDELMKWNNPSVTKITACYDNDLHKIGGITWVPTMVLRSRMYADLMLSYFRGGYQMRNLDDWRFAPRLSRDNEAQMQAVRQEKQRAEQHLMDLNERDARLNENIREWNDNKRRAEVSQDVIAASSPHTADWGFLFAHLRRTSPAASRSCSAS